MPDDHRRAASRQGQAVPIEGAFRTKSPSSLRTVGEYEVRRFSDQRPFSVAASSLGSIASPLYKSVPFAREGHEVRQARGGYERSKRAFDIAFAIFLLVVLSPILLITAILIKATSPGSVIFKQSRTGRDGTVFTCLKFRSMVDRAHDHRHHLLHMNEKEGPIFKMREDPRITRIGRRLRKLSIDEVPQLLNVLAGDMSIVGPRPPLPEEVARYEPHQMQRLSVKPGLTCLWQVSGRSDLSFAEWVALDLEYIRGRGFWLDLKIMARTIPAVLSGKGAH